MNNRALYNRTTYARTEDLRSERRIRNNRIRRQREMKKNFALFLMTVCLIVTCSVALYGFRSDAKDHSTQQTYKYYKSITIDNGDTLWSIAQQYMDSEHYDSVSDYVEEVKSMNALTDDVIHYGEYLVIPYYDSEFVG